MSPRPLKEGSFFFLKRPKTALEECMQCHIDTAPPCGFRETMHSAGQDSGEKQLCVHNQCRANKATVIFVLSQHYQAIPCRSGKDNSQQ